MRSNTAKRALTAAIATAFVGGIGLTASTANAAEEVTITEDDVDTSASSGTGLSEFLANGVHLSTGDGASEAAGYYTIDRPFKASAFTSVSQVWNGSAEPGLRLVIDLANVDEGQSPDGTADGTLTYESVYGGNLWLSPSSSPEMKELAPHTAPGNGNNEGQGSQWYGTLEEWQDNATPGTRLLQGGWVLGLPGHATLKSQTYGDTTYRFSKDAPLPVAKPIADATIDNDKARVGKVRVTATQPAGTQPTPKGAYYKVLKVNPRTDWTSQVTNGRVFEGAQDRVRVAFPKAKKKMQVRVVSYGEIIAQKKIRMR